MSYASSQRHILVGILKADHGHILQVLPPELQVFLKGFFVQVEKLSKCEDVS